MKDIGAFLSLIAVLAIIFACLYGIYWLVANLSYSFFYEDLVMETVNELVQKRCLVGGE